MIRPPGSAPSPLATAVGPRLPAELVIKELLVGVLGREVEITREANTDRTGYTGVCANEAGHIVVGMRMDLPLAAAVGAALGMLPRGRVEEWVAAGSLDDDAFENTSEVMNILTMAFNKADEGRHVRLATVYPQGARLPLEAERVCDAPPASVGFRVDIPGYGAGRLSLFAT